MEELSSLHDCRINMERSQLEKIRRRGRAGDRLTFENQEVVLVRLGEADELDDRWVIRSSHDLDLLQDVGALLE